jgi:hypothetical protein
LKNLTKAIITKAAASNFLTSISSRLRNGFAAESEDYPYCVFLLPVSSDPQSLSSFDKDYEEIRMQFSIFSKSLTEAWTIYGYLTTLYDDCSLSITGRTLLKMERINTTMISEEHTLKDGTIKVFHIATDYLIATKVG